MLLIKVESFQDRFQIPHATSYPWFETVALLFCIVTIPAKFNNPCYIAVGIGYGCIIKQPRKEGNGIVPPFLSVCFGLIHLTLRINRAVNNFVPFLYVCFESLLCFCSGNCQLWYSSWR